MRSSRRKPGGSVGALPEVRVAQATFYRWRQKYGALTKSELVRLKDLERENARLKKLVAELTLDSRSCRTCCQKQTEARASNENLPTATCAGVCRSDQECVPAAHKFGTHWSAVVRIRRQHVKLRRVRRQHHHVRPAHHPVIVGRLLLGIEIRIAGPLITPSGPWSNRPGPEAQRLSAPGGAVGRVSTVRRNARRSVTGIICSDAFERAILRPGTSRDCGGLPLVSSLRGKQ